MLNNSPLLSACNAAIVNIAAATNRRKNLPVGRVLLREDVLFWLSVSTLHYSEVALHSGV